MLLKSSLTAPTFAEQSRASPSLSPTSASTPTRNWVRAYTPVFLPTLRMVRVRVGLNRWDGPGRAGTVGKDV